MAARAIVLAGIAAGVTSTVAQLALWALLTDALPGILFRDARLAAALVLGARALAPVNGFDPWPMAVATLVHFALSIAFAAALAPLLGRCSAAAACVRGAVFGIALYALNLHVLTAVFPWFAAARGAITLAAHVVFGMTAALVYCALRPQVAR